MKRWGIGLAVASGVAGLALQSVAMAVPASTQAAPQTRSTQAEQTRSTQAERARSTQAEQARSTQAARVRSTQAALRWTTTAVNRTPAALSDVDSKAGVTWAVGADHVVDFQDQRPLAMRWDGKKWTAVAQPVRTNAQLISVAIGNAKNVWAVGEDRVDERTSRPLVMHWNGTKWQVVKPPAVSTGTFDDVVVSKDGAVWTTGWANVGGAERAVVYRYAGGKWQLLGDGLEGAINGNVLTVLSANDAWVGLNAGLAHFDGKRWTLVADVPTDGSQIPTGFATIGPKNIWMVGVDHVARELPLAVHYDGKKWTKVAVPAGWAQLYGVTLRNGRPVAVGERFEESGQTILARPLVLEYNGTKFVQAPAPAPKQGTLTAAAAAPDRTWAVGLTPSSVTTDYAAFAAYTR
ncbi:hypothetical protein AB0E69_40595 [Kribbella sp. NPDC026611]|uniref:hypothetical protein n=1 Tax=Kribbella sp. NPDC026611 TaxID=3154911 RepID=UPI003406FA6A